MIPSTTAMPSAPLVALLPGKSKLFYARHPWVFPNAVAPIAAPISNGAIVQLVSHTGHFVGWGLYNAQSRIRIRIHSWDRENPPGPALWQHRIQTAANLRRDLGLMNPDGACRLINSEGDLFSGLVVDRFGGWLVAQISSLGISQNIDTILDILEEEIKPEGIIRRQDNEMARLEGFDPIDALARGKAPPERLLFQEHGLTFGVNLLEGQKTGYYLDQRDNRILAASLAKGRTVLDAFTYAGGFALRAAAAGAQSVVAIDQSQSALDIAALNAEANGFSNKITFHKAEVFDDLSARVSRGERYGLVIVDPPKFARAKNRVEEAMRGYRRLIALALRLTEPEGRVAICSCTGSVSREMLENLIGQVAAEERRDARILHAGGAAPDHPIAMSCPESGYLKFFLLAVS